MAKKIDPVAQSQSYLSNLLGNTDVKTLPQNIVPSAVPQTINIPETPIQKPYVEDIASESSRTAGRKKKNQENKIRTSFTVLPSDLDDLRRIVYMQRKTVSAILCDYIKKYNESHKKALEDYLKLPEEERENLEAGWK